VSDLSFHLDFGCLKRLSEEAGLKAHVTTQADFLVQMGLPQRAEQVKCKMGAADQSLLQASVNRLLDSQQMGTLFKVLTLEKEVA
jgi:SAM-dependent MidA family methyltransferase